jgi:hypothetical protein
MKPEMVQECNGSPREDPSNLLLHLFLAKCHPNLGPGTPFLISNLGCLWQWQQFLVSVTWWCHLISSQFDYNHHFPHHFIISYANKHHFHPHFSQEKDASTPWIP